MNKPAYRWTTELSKLCVLHIDKSAKIAAANDKRKKTQMFSAFLIKAGNISRLDDFTLEDMEAVCQSLNAEFSRPVKVSDKRQFAEQLALLGYFLYRSSSTGIWMNFSDRKKQISSDKIAEIISSKFELKSQ